MTYGTRASSKLVSQGKYDEAIAAAARELGTEGPSSEALFSRGQALAALGRLEEAAADFESALAQDPSASDVDPAAIDDELFDALKSLALERRGEPAALGYLDRYRKALPAGRHVGDLPKWTSHLEGSEALWYRERA